MEGQSCIFTDNPFLGECIYDDTDDNKNLKGKDIVKHPVSMEVSDLISFKKFDLINISAILFNNTFKKYY